MPHPSRLYEVLDARELAEWRAYYQLEPLGEERADLRMARICAVLANTHSSKQTFELTDFLFDFGGKKEQSVEEMKKQLLGALGKGG